MTSLNPVLTIGTQLIETLQEHLELDRREREEAQRRTARRGRHSRARAAAGAISASAFRRHAPAGRDRDRAVLRAEAADRRRADHRARRDHPGANPRSAGARAAPPAHGDDPDHPRSRRRRRPHRRGRGDVCRPRGRARADAGVVQADADALHRGAAGGDPEARRRAAYAVAGDLGPAARSDPAARRVARSRRAAAMPTGRCQQEKPALAEAESPDHQYACFHPIETAAGVAA